MDTPDGFCLGRLRFIRLPPARLSLQRSLLKKPQTLAVELAIGATDDYGSDLLFDSLEIDLSVLDATTLGPVPDVQFRLETPSSGRRGDASGPTPSSSIRCAFSPSQGPVLKLKTEITFLPAFSAGTTPAIVFSLSVPSRPADAAKTALPPASRPTQIVREVIGEARQSIVETWDDRSMVFLGLWSGPVAIRVEDQPLLNASEKVQTAIRTIRFPLPAGTSSASDRPSGEAGLSNVCIVERPGLNNSTGQRLWDCAVAMTAFLSAHPSALDPSTDLNALIGQADETRPAKRARTTSVPGDWAPLRVVELGAGCTLASMAAHHALAAAGRENATVVATDVQATVDTTMRENLGENGLLAGADSAVKGRSGVRAASLIEARVLEWGDMSQDDIGRLLQSGPLSGRRATAAGAGDDPALTLLGTDILYNPDSHSALLATLWSLLRPASRPSRPRRALIAYKRRTAGDDAFFGLAGQPADNSEEGLAVQKVWEWGEVSIYAIT